MNPQVPTSAPSHDATAGPVRDVNQSELEMACVDLICQLECMIATAREAGKEEHMNNASATANKMLNQLLSFSDRFFTGNEAEQTRDEIVKAVEESAAFTTELRSRSWGSTLKGMFGTAEVSDSVRLAYENLGLALIRACATVLYHVIVVVGFESPLGKQIDQSTVVFIRELKESW